MCLRQSETRAALDRRLFCVSFVDPDAYERFMGRFSTPLAPVFADFAGLGTGQRTIDVGCGPGALTTVLVDRLGVRSVAAVDPSPQFLAAVKARHPKLLARLATAEALPFEDAQFDAAVAQLVVHFMADPVAGLREMARVSRPGGIVAACVWDHGQNGRGPLAVFWQAAQELELVVEGETSRTGATNGDLAELFARAGIRATEVAMVSVDVRFGGFEEWWNPFLLGVGSVGTFVARLSSDARAELRARCSAKFPTGAFTVPAAAWAVRGTPD